MLDIKSYLLDEGIAFAESVSSKKLCSFQAGGECALTVCPKSEEQMKITLDYLFAKGKKYKVLGKGSNVVLPDGAYDGVLVLTQGLDGIAFEGDIVKAGAGATLFALARAAEDASLSGLEFAHGIPGSVGGGVYMNAGAYGGELSDRLVSCDCYDLESRQILTLENAECEFSYRHSVFQKNKALIVLSATFRLERGEKESIRERMNEYKRARAEKQPLEYPSAGSTFKRPEGYFAGKLIEDCGLKGFSVGGAAVSEKHAGFVINKGNASANDIVRLVEHIQKTVLEKFGVSLECEIEFID